jgi:hypothetical protein
MLSRVSMSQLKNICRKNKVVGYSRKKKDQLIDWMLDNKNIVL